MLLYRLNYALDLRYGVLLEVAKAVNDEKAIDLSMGYANVIWQGDANEYAIRCLLHCESPAKKLNVTGPETVAIRWLANEFGNLLDKTPVFVNEPAESALLNNSNQAFEQFGLPLVKLEDMIQWTAEWIQLGGKQLNKPTHFQERKGDF